MQLININIHISKFYKKWHHYQTMDGEYYANHIWSFVLGQPNASEKHLEKICEESFILHRQLFFEAWLCKTSKFYLWLYHAQSLRE